MARLGSPVFFRRSLCLALLVLTAMVAVAHRPLTAPLSNKIEIADMTWVEVRTALEHGFTTALVPSGGLEQNGAHMAIGKHDDIVRWTAEQTARGLGKTLVTPVVSFVPEGDYAPPSGHMRFPGTIGVPEPIFAGTLEGIARSLKAAGFKIIAFMGDHGQSQKAQAEVAERLSVEWRDEDVRVVHVSDYYADAPQQHWLQAQGETPETIGTHAGIADTSELLAVRPSRVSLERLATSRFRFEDTGANGDAGRASAERGRTLLAIKVDAAIKQVAAARTRSQGALRLGTQHASQEADAGSHP